MLVTVYGWRLTVWVDLRRHRPRLDVVLPVLRMLPSAQGTWARGWRPAPAPLPDQEAMRKAGRALL